MFSAMLVLFGTKEDGRLREVTTYATEPNTNLK